MTDTNDTPPIDPIQPISLSDEMENSFLEYAMSVIMSRALPDVRDGLKPVHRRIIWDMEDQGFRPDRPHVKCARVTGDTMARFHPHGDSAIAAGIHIIDPLEHQFMKPKKVLLGNDLLRRHERRDKVDRPGMVGGLEMLLEGFSADRQPFLEHNRRFPPRERVALEGVARIGEFDPKPGLEIADGVLRQRPETVERSLFDVDIFDIHP